MASVATTFGEVTAAVVRTRSGAPHEVFLRGAAPGSDAATIVEAIARLASLVLQLPTPVPTADRLDRIIQALAGVHGTRPTTPSVAGSIPVAVAAALASAFGTSPRPSATTEPASAHPLLNVNLQP